MGKDFNAADPLTMRERVAMAKTPEEELAWALLVMSTEITTEMSITGKVPEDIAAIETKAEKAILKHFVPKEEVEAVKRKTLVSIRKKFEGLGFSSELPEEFAKGLEAAQQSILNTLDTELAQLTNNQPNTPKGEGESYK